MPSTTAALLIKDVSIIGAVVVVIVVILISFTVFMVIRFLRSIVDKAETGGGPTDACAAQITAAQAGFRKKVNPVTGQPYTECAAANLAVREIAGSPGSLCPEVPPPVAARAPYSVFLAAQCAPPPPDPD